MWPAKLMQIVERRNYIDGIHRVVELRVARQKGNVNIASEIKQIKHDTLVCECEF